MKHAISTKWLANPNWDHSHFSHNFCGARRNILIIIKVKIFVLSWRLNLEWLSCFEYIVQALLNTWRLLGATPIQMPLKYRCSIKIGDRIRHVYLKLTFHRVILKLDMSFGRGLVILHTTLSMFNKFLVHALRFRGGLNEEYCISAHGRWNSLWHTQKVITTFLHQRTEIGCSTL